MFFLFYSIFEKGIIWRDNPDTSVRLVNDSINMFCDLLIIFDVLKAPKMTEKTLSLKEETNQYAFEVNPRANKIQIKDCVEKTFKVSVLGVRTMNVRGKKKRMGKYQGYKSSWKKALVTLKQGDTIEYFEGA